MVNAKIHHVLTGDECGLIKDVSITLTNNEKTQNAVVSRLYDDANEYHVTSQSRRNALHAITPLHEASQFAALRSYGKNNGIIELYESSYHRRSGQLEHSVNQISALPDVFSQSDDSSSSSGLCDVSPLGLSSVMQNRMLTACDTGGNLTVVDISDLNEDNNGVSLRVRDRQCIFNSVNGVSGNGKLSAFVATTIGSSQIHAACAGRDRETILWDVETKASIWKGKNLPPDPQTLLQQPLWGTSLTFIGSDTCGKSAEGTVLAVGSAYKELRIYDVRAQRRPIAFTKEGVLENRVTSLCGLDNDNTGRYLAVGDSTGDIHNIDLRKMEAVGRFVGPGGSVRQIIRHEQEPIIACVSLDRMLRIYEIKSRKLLSKVYLKQRLNCCQFAPQPRESNNSSSQDDEGVWKEGDEYIKDDVKAYVDSSSEENFESDESRSSIDYREGNSDENESDSDVSDESSLDETVDESPNPKRRREQ